MVLYTPNEKHLLLMRKDRLGIDESILNRFKTDEQEAVLCIMDMIAQSGSVNNTIVCSSTGKSKPTIARLLAKMKEAGLIIAKGSGLAVRYYKSAQIP